MRTHRRIALSLGAFSLALFASFAYGQNYSTPRIVAVSPIGGQAGTTFELNVTGQDVSGAIDLHFNFAGVKVAPAGSAATVIPPKGKGKGGGKGGMIAGGLTTQRFKVTLPANAPLGIQDVRIVTKGGISNPRAFVISDQKEYAEEEPNNDVDKPQKIELNSSVSGVITVPTDVDYFAFNGKKGQRVVCSCWTTSVDSKLTAELEVFGPSGMKLGTSRNFHEHDALVDVALPDDGEYFVRVCSFTYTTGGLDHFYRLTVSTAPWIDAVVPAVVEPGKTTQVTVYGRNLPGGKLDPAMTVDGRVLEKATASVKVSGDAQPIQRLAYAGHVAPQASMIDGFGFQMKNAVGTSNPFLLTYASDPVSIDNGANDEQSKAQKVAAPGVIAGRIQKRGDRDWYAFDAKKGQVLAIEAFADRLGTGADLYFQLRSGQGTLITEQDDNPEILSPQFYTRTDDPAAYRFTVPADGTYYLMIASRDAFTQFGPRHNYTVHIRAEEPDFRLVATPTSPISPEANVVHQSGGAAFTLYVWRTGGFNQEIKLQGANLPPGVVVPPQSISGTQKQAAFVVFAEPGAKEWAGGIGVVATATVKGKTLTREVRAATMTWAVQQPNVPSLTRIDRELAVAVRGAAPYTLAVTNPKINVKQGEKVSIPVKLVPGAQFKGTVQVVAIGGPPGLNGIPISLSPGQPTGTATLDAKGKKGASFPPGNYTLFLRGETRPINPKQKQNPKDATPNIVQISMPVYVSVIPTQLTKLKLGSASAKVSVGKSVEVVVQAPRQYDLPIPFKVELIVPPNVKGISAKDATIAADQEETKLTIAATPQAQAGNQSLTIRATALFNGAIPIVHETKLNLAVGK